MLYQVRTVKYGLRIGVAWPINNIQYSTVLREYLELKKSSQNHQ